MIAGIERKVVAMPIPVNWVRELARLVRSVGEKNYQLGRRRR